MSLRKRTRDRDVVSVERLTLSQSSPLAPGVRNIMEARFGRDFGCVRLHTDNFAAVSASAMGAQAYTYGPHIVFARGCYSPETCEGLWLLAHELSHVIQQGGEASIPPVGIADANGPLERAADRAADLVAANCSLPSDFAYGIAQPGVIQRHNDSPPCSGFAVEPDPLLVRAAERTIELAYEGVVMHAGPYNMVLRGSNNFQPPTGYQAVWGHWVGDLVNFLRQRPIQARPNLVYIIEREVYFFRRALQVNPGLIGMIGVFHGDLDRFFRRIGAAKLLGAAYATWDSADSNWFPDHTLPLVGDPEGRFVCTQATDHNPPRGLIIYDIRSPRRRRRPQRRAVSYELWAADIDMAHFFPHLKEALPKAVRLFEPGNSNFVFIVPADFYYEWYKQTRSNKIWDFFSVAPSYDFPGGQAVKELRSRLHHVSLLLGVAGLAVFAVGTFVFLGALSAAVTAARAVAAAGTAAGASAGAAAVSLPISSTIIVPAEIAAQVAAVGGSAAATAAASGGVTAAMWALAAAPAAKTVMATAGVLLVIGTVNNAHAGTGLPDKPIVTNVSAFRAVAVDDFKPFGNIQAALSSGPPPDFSHTPETAKGKFDVGTKVLFDNVPHIIIGQFSAS